MVNARLSFATAICLLIATLPASAAAPQALTALERDDTFATSGPHPVAHSQKKSSFYCYEWTHWWFYRPYTTALHGHPRCMPYFHYLEPYRGRDERPVK